MTIEDFIENDFPTLLINVAKERWAEEAEEDLDFDPDYDYEESGEWLDTFKSLISNTDEVYDAISDWDSYGIEDLEDVKYGASKIVFVAKDYVYKVVLDSVYLEASESDIYWEAEQEGLGDYFARTGEEYETTFFDSSVDAIHSFHSVFWYRQERVEENKLGRRLRWNATEGDDTCYDRMSKSSRRVYSERYCDDSYYSVLANTGFSDIGKLNKFLSDRCINDLHTGNFRMRRNVPVLIDFSGFC